MDIVNLSLPHFLWQAARKALQVTWHINISHTESPATVTRDSNQILLYLACGLLSSSHLWQLQGWAWLTPALRITSLSHASCSQYGIKVGIPSVGENKPSQINHLRLEYFIRIRCNSMQPSQNYRHKPHPVANMRHFTFRSLTVRALYRGEFRLLPVVITTGKI